MFRLLCIGLLLPNLLHAEPGPMPREVRFDRDGERLPEGAIMRLGTTRYRELRATRMSITEDGTKAICSDDDNVRHWDLRTGKRLRAWPLPEYFRGHVTPDGRFALHLTETTKDRNGGLDVWDVYRQQLLRTITVNGVSHFVTAAISSDGKTIATLDDTPREYRLRLWDMETGTERVIGAVEHDVSSMHFIDNDKRLLLSPFATGQRELDLTDPVVAFDTVNDREAYRIKSAKVSSVGTTGQSFLVLGDRGCYWANAKTGERLQSMNLRGAEPAAYLAMSDEAKGIVYATAERTTEFHPLNKDVAINRVKGAFTAAAFPPNKSTVWLAGRGLVEVELAGQAKVLHGPLRDDGLLDEPTALAWGRMPTVLMAKSGSDQVVYDGATQRRSSSSLPASRWFNKGTSFVEVSWRESQQWRRESPVLPGDDGTTNDWHLTPSPDGQLLVRRSVVGLTTVSAHGQPSQFVLDAATMFRTVGLYERYTGRAVCTLPVGTVGDVAFSSDGRRLATLEPTGFRLWDVVSGKQLMRREVKPFNRPPSGHAFGRGVAFSPEGTTLVIGNRDTTLLIWDINLPEVIARTLHADDLLSLWADLASHDAKAAWQAIKRLRDDPTPSVRFLCDHVKTVHALPNDVAKELLAELDAPIFRRREAAMKKVLAHGDAAQPFVEAALKNNPNADLRDRLEKLNASFAPTVAVRADDLRSLRALAVLQSFLNRDDVRKKLAELAEGLPTARVTKEAKAALERLK